MIKTAQVREILRGREEARAERIEVRNLRYMSTIPEAVARVLRHLVRSKVMPLRRRTRPSHEYLSGCAQPAR